MLSLTGTILKKERKNKTNNAELILMDDFNNTHAFQVRPKKIHKLVEIDTKNKVHIFYKTELSERVNNITGEINRVTYMILEDIKIISNG